MSFYLVADASCSF